MRIKIIFLLFILNFSNTYSMNFAQLKQMGKAMVLKFMPVIPIILPHLINGIQTYYSISQLEQIKSEVLAPECRAYCSYNNGNYYCSSFVDQCPSNSSLYLGCYILANVLNQTFGHNT